MIAMLLAAPAMALDLSVDTTVFGASDAWTVEGVEYGAQDPVVLEGEGRTSYRIELTLREHTDGVRYEVAIVEVTHGWLGREKEAVISQPVLIAPLDEPAVVEWGAKGQAPDVSVRVVASR